MLAELHARKDAAPAMHHHTHCCINCTACEMNKYIHLDWGLSTHNSAVRVRTAVATTPTAQPLPACVEMLTTMQQCTQRALRCCCCSLRRSGQQNKCASMSKQTPAHPPSVPTQCFLFGAASNETPGLPNNMTQAQQVLKHLPEHHVPLLTHPSHSPYPKPPPAC
jgi:hypothetical protein